MITVNISELRANLLRYLEVASTGEQISVTSNGRIMATISPPLDQQQQASDQLKVLAKTAILKDVVTPTGSKWDALA